MQKIPAQYEVQVCLKDAGLDEEEPHRDLSCTYLPVRLGTIRHIFYAYQKPVLQEAWLCC